jgi:hypothetical protein
MQLIRTDEPPCTNHPFSAAAQFEGGGSITTQITQLPQGLFETAVMLG